MGGLLRLLDSGGIASCFGFRSGPFCGFFVFAVYPFHFLVPFMSWIPLAWSVFNT